jgi:hypothetical protein
MTTASVIVDARAEEIALPRDRSRGGTDSVDGVGSGGTLFGDQASHRRVRKVTIAAIAGVQLVWVTGLAYELVRLFG